MTREEFAGVMAYLSAGCARPVTKEQAEVYWDLLGDLPLPALRLAAQRALLEGQYPTLPPVGVLRRLAVAAEGLTAAEAWGLVRSAMNRLGYTATDEDLRRALPPVAAAAALALGWRNLCDSTEPHISYAQFRDAYEALAGRARRESLLPAPLKEALRQIGREVEPVRQLAGTVRRIES